MIDTHNNTTKKINADAAHPASQTCLGSGGGESSEDGVEHENDFESRTSSIVVYVVFLLN